MPIFNRSVPPLISSQIDFFGSRVAALIDVSQGNRLADTNLAAIGLFLTYDHAKQRRLAGAVGADHADDTAGRELERHVVHQQVITVGFADSFRFDHDVAQARPRRNGDL